MIKGISYLSFENGLSNNESIESALIQTQSNGFKALELSVSNEGVINTNLSESECIAIRQKINDSGVFVDSIATGMSWGISPTSDDAGVRKNSLYIKLPPFFTTRWVLKPPVNDPIISSILS